jgi:tetratricopeptide (TPR) repeat protein
VGFLQHPRQAPGGSPTPAEIARRALLSFDAVLRGDRDAASDGMDAVREMASEGEAADVLLPPPAGAVRGLSLWLLGRYGEAGEVYDREVEAARERGSLLDLAVCLEGRAGCNWGRGDVNACLADIETLLGLNEEGWETATVAVRSLAAEMLLERGDRQGAEAALAPAEEVEERLPGTLGWYFLPYGRTRLALDAGDWQTAREQARTIGERLLAIQAPSPDYLPWRSLAARAAARMDDEEGALSLAEEELELARSSGSHRAAGVALATLGTIRGADGGLDLLLEAVAELDRTEAELEPARARSPPRAERGRVADSGPAARGEDGGKGNVQPRDRRGPVRHPPHGRDPPHAGIQQARDRLARGAAGGAGGGPSLSEPLVRGQSSWTVHDDNGRPRRETLAMALNKSTEIDRKTCDGTR